MYFLVTAGPMAKPGVKSATLGRAPLKSLQQNVKKTTGGSALI